MANVTRPADPRRTSGVRFQALGWLTPWALQALLVAGGVYWAFLGWARDWRVPLRYSNDALEYLMQAKGTLERGWWWFHPRAGAPSELSLLAYPSHSNVDQAIVWLTGLVVADVGLAVNVSWLLMVVLSGLVAAACLRRLGVGLPLALVAGVVFALAPYALHRNINHLALAIYLVPVPCTAALLVATGRLDAVWTRQHWWMVAGCALIGLNYIYYSFFAAFLLLVATLMAASAGYRPAARSGLVLLLVTSLTAAVNVTPTLAHWAVHGPSDVVPAKAPAEADVYGLKIRDLVSPVGGHTFPWFRRWLEREEAAAFPLRTESTRSRLGLVTTAGFLLLLWGVLFPAAVRARHGPILSASGRLVLALLLLATVGGFGSLFNLFVAADIRAYARVAPFIAFFSAAGLVCWLARAVEAGGGTGRARRREVALCGVLLAVGVYDQRHAATYTNRMEPNNQRHHAEVSGFVQTLEGRLPADSMVFQFPVTVFLNDGGTGDMGAYDHLKLYLASRHVRWSYPTLDAGLVRWQQEVGDLPPAQMMAALRAAGFAAVVIDRAGLPGGDGAIRAEWASEVWRAAVLAESTRYVALDLTRLPAWDGDPAMLPRPDQPRRPATVEVPACAGPTDAFVDTVASASPPFDHPLHLNRRDTVSVTGWAVDRAGGRAASAVDLEVGPALFPAFYGRDRSDVADAFGVAAYRHSGFTARLRLDDLPAGAWHLQARILSADRRCAYVTPIAILVLE